jgi:hypothetical protein
MSYLYLTVELITRLIAETTTSVSEYVHYYLIPDNIYKMKQYEYVIVFTVFVILFHLAIFMSACTYILINYIVKWLNKYLYMYLTQGLLIIHNYMNYKKETIMDEVPSDTEEHDTEQPEDENTKPKFIKQKFQVRLSSPESELDDYHNMTPTSENNNVFHSDKELDVELSDKDEIDYEYVYLTTMIYDNCLDYIKKYVANSNDMRHIPNYLNNGMNLSQYDKSIYAILLSATNKCVANYNHTIEFFIDCLPCKNDNMTKYFNDNIDKIKQEYILFLCNRFTLVKQNCFLPSKYEIVY